MEKWTTIILILILLAVTVNGYTQIQYSLDNITFTNVTNTDQNFTIIEELGDGIDECTTYYFRLRQVYTTDNSSWNYHNERTACSGEMSMSSLGIIIFIMTITLAVFLVPFFVKKLSKIDYVDSLIRGLLIILGLFLVSLDITMVATISETFEIGVTQEIFRFLWLVNWTIYVSMVFVLLVFGRRVLNQWENFKIERRYGDNVETGHSTAESTKRFY